MVVQHNLTAMNSNRMLGLTTASQAKSTEKLSSGYKINRAADDAAGLAISEKMRRQVRGLTQASANAQDGISAVQTAEGALTEVHDMLQRMNELATKSANGTNSQEERDYIQSEVDALISEIDRVAETTKFNEIYLLKGDGTETKTETVNTPAQDAVDVKVEYQSGYGTESGFTFATGKADSDIAGLGNSNGGIYAAGSSTAIKTLADLKQYLVVKDDGTVGLKEGTAFYKEAASSSTEWGNQKTAVTEATIVALVAKDSTKLATDNAGTLATDATLKAQFNTDGTYKGGLYYKNTAGTWTEVGADRIGEFVKVTPGSDAVAAGTKEVSTTVTKALEFKLHVGAEGNEANKITVKIAAMTAKGIGIDGLKTSGVKSEDAATKAIETIKASIKQVSQQRSDLGAVQNRLEHTINNLDNIVENTQAAESAIRDTDMATEMVKYANNNILAQAGQAMLAQANQANQGVLSLLG